MGSGFTRRAALREAADRAGMFVPLRIADAAVPAKSGQATADTLSAASSDAAAGTAMIEIERGRLRVRFSGPVDAAALHVVLAHVGRRA